MLEKIVYIAGMVVAVIWFTGCVAPEKRKLLLPSRAGAISEEYVKSAEAYEDREDLVGAFEQYRLALTADSGNEGAEQGAKRMESEIQAAAERHYQAGNTLQQKGRYTPARKEYLTALRLNPRHQGVREKLSGGKRAPALPMNGFLLHKVQPGETLSKIAETYYGDHSKFAIIAKANRIGDVTAIRVGQKIRIPGLKETAGVAQLEDKGAASTMDRVSWDWEGTYSDPEAKNTGEVEKEKEKEEVVDQAVIYRDHGVELFQEEKYEEALVEFAKVLATNPRDETALDYAYRCSFHQAVGLYQQKDYLGAREQFQASLRYKASCRQCHTYIENCENSYKEFHYKKGMQLYDKERLEEAVREWELVRAEDSEYKRVDYLINKAKTIQKNLNKLKGN